MPLFPLFVSLHQRDILIIGGGEVALRKIEKLLPFGPKLTIIAPKLHPQLVSLAYAHTYHPRPFVIEDLAHRDMVIGALDDLAAQEEIFRYCDAHHIWVNCVDAPQWCSFIFPALIVEEELCIGINTNAKAPAISRFLREYFQARLPQGIHDLIARVDTLRRTEPKGPIRQNRILAICQKFFDQNV